MAQDGGCGSVYGRASPHCASAAASAAAESASGDSDSVLTFALFLVYVLGRLEVTFHVGGSDEDSDIDVLPVATTCELDVGSFGEEDDGR